MADETPRPMPLLVVCRTIITRRKRQRGASERIGSDAAEKGSVERDHDREREQVEDVRRSARRSSVVKIGRCDRRALV